jgi:hypothetical protein
MSELRQIAAAEGVSLNRAIWLLVLAGLRLRRWQRSSQRLDDLGGDR